MLFYSSKVGKEMSRVSIIGITIVPRIIRKRQVQFRNGEFEWKYKRGSRVLSHELRFVDLLPRNVDASHTTAKYRTVPTRQSIYSSNR